MKKIILKDVASKYRRTSEPQIHDINLEINEGELILLSGPSGSGKSTLTLLINGIIPHHSRSVVTGTISVFGKNPMEEKVANMASLVGMLLQDPESQLATSRVMDEIILTLEFQGKSKEEIDEKVRYLLERFELVDYAEADSTRLSGGEKQLVALAAMLSLDPQIIILDEPTSNLDPYNTAKVLNHISTFKEEGKTVILIEHKMNEVFNHCQPDRIVLMNKGTIFDEGTPKEIFEGGSLQKIGLNPPRIYSYCSELLLTDDQRHKIPFSFKDFGEFQFLLTNEQKKELKTKLSSFTRINLESDQPLLNFSNITFTYRNQAKFALQNVTSTINQGEFIAIVGNNGAGKSTLVKHIIGLIKPKGGELILDGKNTKELTAAKLAHKVAFLFQNPDYQLFNATVIKEVAYGAKNVGMKKELALEKAKESVVAVKLAEYLEQDPLKLSMGQKQRVAVASALTMSPEVYVLDEPTTGQDPTSLKGIMDLMINEYEVSNATIILVTHDMDLVDSVANRTIVLSQGEILLDDRTDIVFSNKSVMKQANLEPPTRMHMLNLVNN